VNYANVAQPPDFQFFIDNTIGDSLRTDVRRQGNPNLAFERGRVYEAGGSHLFGETVGLELALFWKDLTDLVTGNLELGGTGPGQYTTGDEGTVKGVELNVRGRWPGVEARLGYALMEATGLTTGAANDTTPLPPGQTREFPLAFDRRHTIDATIFLGRAAGRRGATGLAGLPVGAVVTARVRSGYPLYLEEGANGQPTAPEDVERLPWTAVVDLGLSWDVTRLPGCASCGVRLVFQAKNLLGRDNVIALRRDSGRIAPTLESVEELAGRPVTTTIPVPAESPRYAPEIDLDANGRITADEFETARFAAALDRNDPSLFYGEEMQLRLGVEVTF
jgi:outer membrane receptor protein involved in Fe transport